MRTKRVRFNAPRAGRSASRKDGQEPLVLTLDCWRDGKRYLGQLREATEAFGRGNTLAELRASVHSALMNLLKEGFRTVEELREPPRGGLDLDAAAAALKAPSRAAVLRAIKGGHLPARRDTRGRYFTTRRACLEFLREARADHEAVLRTRGQRHYTQAEVDRYLATID